MASSDVHRTDEKKGQSEGCNVSGRAALWTSTQPSVMAVSCFLHAEKILAASALNLFGGRPQLVRYLGYHCLMTLLRLGILLGNATG